ncbi:hypothetical protein GCM10007852_17750 [Agaribacter marinus]|uniref:Uncharacterized protein n=2 Tax=Agaribacter marinus TaxID=1431249 RepID=A0AA37SXF2_9ALTE|nr:hypothetical protein GCM10007852_17750 [Agaribacter marinus]
MGEELMGATFSNPLGHVEDMPVVRLHDKIYHLNGSDWRYHDSSPLIKPIWLPNYIESYIKQRRTVLANTDSHKLLGVKDPRAVHFLKDWNVAGGEDIRFVFIYRDWKTASYSLLKRHSRHFISSAHDIEKHVENLSFWQQQSLAYDMWLSANNRICDFVDANKDKCLLVSQESLVSGAKPPASICTKIGLDSTYLELSTYQDDILTKSAPECGEKMLDASKVEQLNACFERLERLSDLPNLAYQQASILLPEVGTLQSSIFADVKFDFSQLAWSELRGALIRIPQARYHFSNFKNVLHRDGGNAEDYCELAKVGHMQGQWVIARVLKIRSSILHLLDKCRKKELPLDMGLWDRFFEGNSVWYKAELTDLPYANPFSLRRQEDLPDNFNLVLLGMSTSQVSSIDWLLAQAAEYKDETLSLYLSFILLTKQLSLCDYICIAEEASRNGLFNISEFVGFHILRLGNKTRNYRTISKALLVLEETYIYLENDQFLSFVYDFADKSGDEFTKNVFKKCEDTREDKLVVSSERDHKPLSHRFALLPHNIDYKRILSIGYDDIENGKLFDKLNNRLSFLAKDNTLWLNKGLNAIYSTEARECLSYVIDFHWRALWPKQILQFIFNGVNDDNECRGVDKNVNVPSKENTLINKSAIHICVYDFEPKAFDALITLISQQAGLYKVSIFLEKLDHIKYGSKLNSYNNVAIDVHIIDKVTYPSLIKSILSVKKDNDGIAQCEWTALMHCRCSESELSRQRLVLAWYSMLGGQHAFYSLYSGMGEFEHSPHLALPSYPPWVLPDIQDKPRFYPLDKMFCINKKGLELASMRTEVIDHRWLTKLINEFKRTENSISFVHQRFLERFV